MSEAIPRGPAAGMTMPHPEPTCAVPRVSVVIPAYNRERYIAAAVRSALNAGEPDVEVLVIDDGSTDRTVAEVRALNDPRVTITSISRSGGPSRPRNVGIRQARAPYVSLLDSDDLLKPTKLASSVTALERCPSAGFAFGDFETIDEDGNIIETSVSYAFPALRAVKSRPAGNGWRLIPQVELARTLARETFIGTSGVVIRKDLAVTLGGFDETLVFAEDTDFWFRLAHRTDALLSSSVGHSYRVHSASLCGGWDIHQAQSAIRVLRREKARRRDRGEQCQLDWVISRYLHFIGRHHRQQGAPWKAVCSHLHGFAVSPQRDWFLGLIRVAFFTRRQGPEA
jgi:glycosyltransferase involved in cell wall biosynthesis